MLSMIYFVYYLILYFSYFNSLFFVFLKVTCGPSFSSPTSPAQGSPTITITITITIAITIAITKYSYRD